MTVQQKSNIAEKTKNLEKTQTKNQESLAKQTKSKNTYNESIKKNQARQTELSNLAASEERLKNKEVADYNQQIKEKNIKITREFERCKSRLGRRRRRRSPGWGSFKRAFKRVTRPVFRPIRKITAPIRHPIKKLAKNLLYKCRQQHQTIYPNAAVVNAIRKVRDDKIRMFNKEKAQRQLEMTSLIKEQNSLSEAITKLNNEIQKTNKQLTTNKKDLAVFDEAFKTLTNMKTEVSSITHQVETIKNNFQSSKSRMFDLKENIVSQADDLARLETVKHSSIQKRFLERMGEDFEKEIIQWINMARLSYLANKNVNP